MNAQNSSPTPAPVPMQKEKILKEDGRFLYYYSFPQEQGAERPAADGAKTEDTDV